MDLEAAALINSTCNTNALIEAQVAKSFWDLNDVNNESGTGTRPADQMTESELDIVSGWALFGNGTGNRQNDESGTSGAVNLRDYIANTSSLFGSGSAYTQTMLDHNCLLSQDDT